MAALMALPRLKCLKRGLALSSPLLALVPHADTSQVEVKKTSKKLFKVSELPIYENEENQKEYMIVEKPYSWLERSVSSVRQSVVQTFSSLEGPTNRVKTFYETGVAHTKSTYEYITNEANTVPRAATITLGGLGGLLLGARGGIIKKVFYTGTGLLVTASICYPKQAVEISKTGYDRVREQGFTTIKDYTGYDLNNIFKPIELKMKEIHLPTFVADMFGQQKPKSEKDFGQSNPADKDMYTTRGS